MKKPGFTDSQIAEALKRVCSLPCQVDSEDVEFSACLTSSHELDISDLENPAGLRFIKLLGKQRWRDIIQRRMRSKMTIVVSPGFDLFLGVFK